MAEPSAVWSTRANEIGVTPYRATARTLRTVFFETSPEVATCKPKKHRWTSRLRPFPLERVENLFDRVSHIQTGRAGVSLFPDTIAPHPRVS